jgi:hypothetical protein
MWEIKSSYNVFMREDSPHIKKYLADGWRSGLLYGV